MHLEVKRNLPPSLCGEGFTGKDTAAFLRGRTHNSFPLWEEFVWKDSYAFKVEESLTPYSYIGKDLWGR